MQDLLRGVGHRGEGIGGEDRQRLDLGQALVCRLGGAERRADDGPLDLAEGAPGRSARFERFLGGDEVTGRRTLEIVRLHPADPNVAVSEQPPLHTLLADEVSLRSRSLPARRAHALAATLGPRRGLIGGNRRRAVLSGVDKRSRCRLLAAVVTHAFAGANFTTVGWYVGVRR